MKTEIPLVPVSWGEFTDKLTILELKKERVLDQGKKIESLSIAAK